jgi:hypothetical protein
MILIFSFIFKCFISILLLLFSINYLVKNKLNSSSNINLSILNLSSISLLSCLYSFTSDSNLFLYIIGMIPITFIFLMHMNNDKTNKELYLILFTNIILLSLNYFFIVIILNIIYYVNSIYFEQFNIFFKNDDQVDNDDIVL